ncbi:S1C family serine protease, partial [Selenomonas noxia]|uniref:S1C family serine protease n=1 Tax=Selenomonas noxia TaxID=135083 RepID=UPI003C7089E8
MNIRLKRGKGIVVTAAAVLASLVIFGGCSMGTAADNSVGGIKPAQSVDVSGLSDARNTPVVRAAKAVGPAVVGITNKAVARDWFNNPVETEGVGSGVVFRSDGYIVTNYHVISGAKEIIVSLSDGRSLKGKLIGQDEFTDLAVVKVDANDLPTAVFGNSDTVVVGEPAIAIGNPLGLEFQGSVTVGVISALNRTLDVSDKRVKLLQTDAAISPGNSGGALVNADGEVIGINSAKVAAAAVEGMGFSIPINTVQTIINELIEKGYVARPYLGVSVFDPTTAARYGYQLKIDKG